MNNTGSSKGRLALLVALVALVPAFGQWLFPIVRARISVDPHEVPSFPEEFSLLDISLSPYSGKGLEESALWLNGQRIEVLGPRGTVVKISPGEFQMFLETRAAKSNLLTAKVAVGETIRVICSSAPGVAEEVFCDSESRPALATIHVRRRHTWAASSIHFGFFVNGRKLASLANGEEGEIKVEPGSYELSVVIPRGGLVGAVGGPFKTRPIFLELGPGNSATIECQGVLGVPDTAECKALSPRG